MTPKHPTTKVAPLASIHTMGLMSLVLDAPWAISPEATSQRGLKANRINTVTLANPLRQRGRVTHKRRRVHAGWPKRRATPV